MTTQAFNRAVKNYPFLYLGEQRIQLIEIKPSDPSQCLTCMLTY